MCYFLTYLMSINVSFPQYSHITMITLLSTGNKFQQWAIVLNIGKQIIFFKCKRHAVKARSDFVPHIMQRKKTDYSDISKLMPQTKQFKQSIKPSA